MSLIKENLEEKIIFLILMKDYVVHF